MRFSITVLSSRAAGEFMGSSDDYRAHSDECRELAELAINPKSRERWLTLAAEWLYLADGLPCRPKEIGQTPPSAGESPGAGATPDPASADQRSPNFKRRTA